jgi:hypothetical protein
VCGTSEAQQTAAAAAAARQRRRRPRSELSAQPSAGMPCFRLHSRCSRHQHASAAITRKNAAGGGKEVCALLIGYRLSVIDREVDFSRIRAAEP